MDDTKRRVVTLANAPIGSATKGPGVPFQYAALFAAPKGPAMLNSLSPDATIQQEMISYLRGGTTFNAGAVTIEGLGIGQFRKRFGSMGDISNAQPAIVPPTGNGFDDDGTAASRTRNMLLHRYQSRAPVVPRCAGQRRDGPHLRRGTSRSR